MVYLPQRRILFAGDILFYYVTPPAHNGHITRWIDAIDVVNRMDVDVIVPGHGPIGSKKELAETRAYLELVANELRKRHAIGMSPGRAAADIERRQVRAVDQPGAQRLERCAGSMRSWTGS